jgi:hypothetical protein
MLKGESRQALLLTLGVWVGFVYGSYVLSELIAGRTAFLRDMPLDVPAVLLVALLAYPLYPLGVRTAGMAGRRRWPLVACATVCVAFAQSLVNLAENRLLGVVPAIDASHMTLIRDRFGRNFLSHVYLSFANAALLIFLVEAGRSAQQRVATARAEAIAAEARTTVLRLQLNPHFLFNTLNSISSLVVVRRIEDAEEMIERLADFLRHSLSSDPNELVPLEEEFATIETYLEIEAVRFGERMTVKLECPPELAQVMVPGFLLQPLAENAVKFGVARASQPVTVCIEALTEGADLLLRVCDDAPPIDKPATAQVGLGIGVQNVIERLAARYGPTAQLTSEATAHGHVATIRLPLNH